VYDLVIRNALLADGSGRALFTGDVAVSGTKIAAVGEVAEAGSCEFDATGLTLCPGFINSHGHADMVMEAYPALASDLGQGITTQIAGNCGIGAAPFSSEHLEAARSVTSMLTPYDFASNMAVRRDYASYVAHLARARYGTNIGLLLGHGALRCSVMGLEKREPTAPELELMCHRLGEALQAGARGLSFGLEYPPGCFASRKEMLALSRVVAEAHGVVSAHIRNEDDTLVESVEEMLDIVKASGVRFVFSHHKSIYQRNWSKTRETLARIDAARSEGAEVYCDQYPYLAASTGLKSRLPARLFTLNDAAIVRLLRDPKERPGLRLEILGNRTLEEKFGETMIGSSPSHPEMEGHYLIELARERGLDPVMLLLDVLADDRLTTNGIFTYMDEGDVERVMRSPWTMIGTDGLYTPDAGAAHPRAFGSFARLFSRYVRERSVLTFEEAVRRITALPSSVYGLTGKGRLAEGFDADFVLLQADRVADRATFKDFSAPNVGFVRVYVAGTEVLRDGKSLNRLIGRVLV